MIEHKTSLDECLKKIKENREYKYIAIWFVQYDEFNFGLNVYHLKREKVVLEEKQHVYIICKGKWEDLKDMQDMGKSFKRRLKKELNNSVKIRTYNLYAKEYSFYSI